MKESTKSNPTVGEGSDKKPSRREFLYSSGGVVLGAAVSGCHSAIRKQPMTARAYGKIIGANDRIRVGFIGTGGMGTGQIFDIVGRGDRAREAARRTGLAEICNLSVTAVCDVYEPRRERAKEISGGKAYLDHQELLASGEVDCVIIATPEHWHHRQTLDSLRAGMDVYLQKPMTRTVSEALEIRDAFRNSDRIFQLGSQYCQTPAWWKARQLFDSGLLGKVVLSQTSYHRNSKGGEWNYDIDKDVRPGENLDWKRWLGPLPDMKYDPEYYFRWRKYAQFSGGIITDLLPHKIHSLAYVLGAGKDPRNVNCVGGIYVHPDRTVADTVAVTVDYGDSVMMVSGATCNERGLEDMIRGHRATLYIGETSVRVTPERPFVDEIDAIEERLDPAPMDSNQYHMKEFFDCMRTRKQPTWDVEASCKVMTAIAMAETAYLQKRTIHFDAEHERLT